MTVWETIKTWSLMETLISVIGLGLTVLLSTVVSARVPAALSR